MHGQQSKFKYHDWMGQDSPLVFDEQTCWHEAGHAVAFAAAGVPCFAKVYKGKPEGFTIPDDSIVIPEGALMVNYVMGLVGEAIQTESLNSTSVQGLVGNLNKRPDLLANDYQGLKEALDEKRNEVFHAFAVMEQIAKRMEFADSVRKVATHLIQHGKVWLAIRGEYFTIECNGLEREESDRINLKIMSYDADQFQSLMSKPHFLNSPQ